MRILKLLCLSSVFICGMYDANSQIISEFAGVCNLTAPLNGNFGPATSAKLATPRGIVSDNSGNVYFIEMLNYAVRKVNTTGVITTYAGNGTEGFGGDGGSATNAQMEAASGLAIDKVGNIYIGDGVNNRVRRVDVAGIITTFAGNGTLTPLGDGGPATAAGLGNVGGICFDTAGNLYIAAGKFIRKVNAAGIITKYAGTGVSGYSGDGGMADTAKLTTASIDYLSTDLAGNIFFATSNRIRKISTSGIITTIGGNAAAGYSGDFGPAIAALFAGSGGVFPDSCGNLYIADYPNNVVRIISTAGIVYTIAGHGTIGCGGNGGPAIAAQMNHISTVYLDKKNDLYLSDHLNHVVRKIHFPRCDSLVFPIAVDEVEMQEDGVYVFPNPSDGDFSIKINTGSHEPVRVVIVTMVGAVVREYIIRPGKETPLQAQLPAGMYMVVCENEKGRIVKKVVVR